MSIVPSREEALFSDALAQPPAERATFLAKACGADIALLAKGVVARFEAERQAVAMMDHPNIAKVHDAGATETGRPFLMELVRGIPILKYSRLWRAPSWEEIAAAEKSQATGKGRP